MQGFEPRGTDISKRLITYQNIIDNAHGYTDLLPYDRDSFYSSIVNTSSSNPGDVIWKKHKSTEAGDVDDDDQVNFLVDWNVKDVLSLRPKFYFCGLPSQCYYLSLFF